MTANKSRAVGKCEVAANRKQRKHGVLLRTVISAAMGFLLGGVSVLDDCAPLAVAYVGCSGAGLAGAAALAGATSGYAVFYGLGDGIQYIAAALMVYTVGFVCQYITVSGNRWFMPCVVMVMVGLTVAFGTVSAVRTDLPYLLRLGLDVLGSGILTYLYGNPAQLFEKETDAWTDKELVSVFALVISVLAALSYLLEVNGISVGRITAGLCVMGAVYCGGAGGCYVAAGIGIAIDMISAAPSCFTIIYTVSALFMGMVRAKGKLLSALGYVLGTGLVAVAYLESELALNGLYETGMAAILFLGIPGMYLRRWMCLTEGTVSRAGDGYLRRYAAGRLRRMSDAFCALGELLTEEEAGIAEPTLDEIFDRAAEAVCAGCGKKSICWTNHYLDMLVVLGEAAPVMARRGQLAPQDLPDYFRDYCPNSDQLVLAINYELRRNVDKRMLQLRRRESTAVGAAQYGDFGEILSELSEKMQLHPGVDVRCQQKLLRWLQAMKIQCEVSAFCDGSGRLRIWIWGKGLGRMLRRPGYMEELSEALGYRLCRPGGSVNDGVLLLEAEPLAVTVGVASRKKRGEDVSGDRGRYFKTDEGILYVILSDGLGTGDDAAAQSSVVVDVLEKLLRSGLSPMSAVKLTNAAMQLKNGEDWGYATIDLLSLNLFSGEAIFYKYGAAPSYVFTQEGIVRVSGVTLSAGMEADTRLPDCRRMNLSPGDIVVIASDGVDLSDEKRLLRRIFEERENMKHLARGILLSAREDDPFGDDMTVLAIGLEERK